MFSEKIDACDLERIWPTLALEARRAALDWKAAGDPEPVERLEEIYIFSRVRPSQLWIAEQEIARLRAKFPPGSLAEFPQPDRPPAGEKGNPPMTEAPISHKLEARAGNVADAREYAWLEAEGYFAPEKSEGEAAAVWDRVAERLKIVNQPGGQKTLRDARKAENATLSAEQSARLAAWKETQPEGPDFTACSDEKDFRRALREGKKA